MENEIRFLCSWDEYDRKELGEDRYNSLLHGFIRELAENVFKRFGEDAEAPDSGRREEQ